MKYLDKDLLTISSALKNNEITKEDLYNEAVDNINSTNDSLNAFILVNDKINKINSNSILSGIPYGLKDNISTKGIKTTACSNTLKNYVPIYSATCYEKLEKSGAVMIGKNTMDELAMGGYGNTGNTGVVKNPWDINRIAGGSSAGSAACVAKGIVPYVVGTDTGDSIRKPAAYTGIVGYKPSYGLISRYGVFAFSSSLDHVGVLTRNVYDAAIVVDEIKGHDNKDMTSINDMDDISLKDYINNNVKGKKLFYIKNLLNKNDYTNKNTLKIIDNFNELINKVKDLGIKVYEEEIDINLLKAIKPIYDSISSAEATSNNSNLTGIIFGNAKKKDNVNDMMKSFRSEGFSSYIKRRFVIGSFVLQKENQEKYFINAKKVRRLLVDKFNSLFKKYDGLIMPASADIAPLIKDASNIIKNDEATILDNYLAIGNFGGYPSITIPCGFINKMPIGINITGAYKDDGNILNIASEVESILEYKNMIAKGDKK